MGGCLSGLHSGVHKLKFCEYARARYYFAWLVQMRKVGSLELVCSSTPVRFSSAATIVPGVYDGRSTEGCQSLFEAQAQLGVSSQ